MGRCEDDSGVIFLVIGLIVFIIAHVSAAAGFDVETQGGSTSFTLTLTGTDSDLGHTVYVRVSENCEEQGFFDLASPTWDAVHSPTGTEASMHKHCGMINTDAENNWEAAHDPPLRSVGTFNKADDQSNCGNTDHCSADDVANNMCFERCLKLAGAYQVTCSTQCWVVDVGEEIGEAIGGIMAAIGLFIVMIILLLVGGILLCVACCCCCQGPDKGAQQPPVQGQVIGQPVYAQPA